MRRALLAVCACAAMAAAAAASSTAFYANSFQRSPTAAELTALGRVLFFDPALSASGKMACSGCHDPRHAYAPANALAVQRGGLHGLQFGVRAVPTLMYAQNAPPFTEHFVDDEGDDSVDQGPAGGRTWDGRAQSAHEQAELPLLSSFEMANASAGDVVARVKAGIHAAQLKAVFGGGVFDDPVLAFKGIVLALETWQQDAPQFYPYSSKYDAWLRQEASLDEKELRGLAAFNDPQAGNCARCHPSARRAGAFPQFTDFGYAAIGVPRNAAIPANRVASYFDLGLCGPWRTDLQEQKAYCGLFKTPTLRNVATRGAYFHNGVVHDLRDAVRFYAERDTHAQRWYPSVHGATQLFDDVPRAYLSNIDVQAPFGVRDAARSGLSDADVDAIVAFLQTLTDGYSSSGDGGL